MKPGAKRTLACTGAGAGIFLLLLGFGWLRFFPQGTPQDLLRDIRAGIPARALKDPDARLEAYLTRRYGPLSDPANRQRVFLEFFDPERIKVLQLIVRHSPDEQRQANIDAMARWIAAYREGLDPIERAGLGALFQTPEGQAQLRRATAQYNAQDVRYRGSTTPVISQLLRTINEVEQAR
ncbi:MAG TPA: hypothetical protein PKM73_08950 [Verrucomicrobiota bacterium]|nr:hypothetical protein [Verrucomicrobiota bacterium]HNU51876.1 hypothetical protein [Verrucomicrobiota bacterium]